MKQIYPNFQDDIYPLCLVSHIYQNYYPPKYQQDIEQRSINQYSLFTHQEQYPNNNQNPQISSDQQQQAQNDLLKRQSYCCFKIQQQSCDIHSHNNQEGHSLSDSLQNNPCPTIQSINNLQITQRIEPRAPKPLLRINKEILLSIQGTNQEFKDKVKEVNQKQTNACFIKLCLLADKVMTMKDFKKKFKSSCKKYELQKYSQWKQRMLDTMSCYCRSDKKRHQVYWGNHNHPKKYEQSWNQVKKFKKEIKNMKFTI